jgi:ATP-dependent RNA helicase DDX55/SPB4
VQHPYINEALEEVDPPDLDPGADQLLSQMRAIVLTDRELADKAAKAFVSALRAYSKHEATFIFKVADVDFNSLAAAFGLLRLPAMPEVREWKKKEQSEADWTEADVDVSPPCTVLTKVGQLCLSIKVARVGSSRRPS